MLGTTRHLLHRTIDRDLQSERASVEKQNNSVSENVIEKPEG